jgi:glycosyltransferase involved in cell wall biosynthesis
MRIAQVAPLAEPVPPVLYGGTERVVSVLTEELVRRGHEVTLFASGDSQTSAELVPCAPRGLRLDPTVKDTVAPALIELGEVYGRADEFDVIHNHVDYFAFPFARLSSTPTITTTHGRLDLSEVRRVYDQFQEQRLVSISNDQASRLPFANWIATVYNTVDLSNLHFRNRPGDYLVFLGRIHPDKRPDRAIEMARVVGMRIVIAAKVADIDRAYYETVIKPLVDASPLVEFVGEVDEAGKDELLGGAYACLFPIDWPEPFGLTMIESMATGTPVIAMRNGAVPEVIVDGVTGFVCDSFKGMIEAVERVGELDRARCRDHVEQKFSPTTMAAGYEAVYQSVVESMKPHAPIQLTPAPSLRTKESFSVPARRAG